MINFAEDTNNTIVYALVGILIFLVFIAIILIGVLLSKENKKKQNKEILEVDKTSEIVVTPDAITTLEVELDPELVLLKQEGDAARQRIFELENRLKDYSSNINNAKINLTTETSKRQIDVYKANRSETTRQLKAIEKQISQNSKNYNDRKEEIKRTVAKNKNYEALEERVTFRQHIRTTAFKEIMRILEERNITLHWFQVMKAVIGIDSAMMTQYNFDQNFVRVYMLRINYIIDNFLDWNESRKKIVLGEIEKAVNIENWTLFQKTVNKWFSNHIKFIDTPKRELKGVIEVDFYPSHFVDKQKFINDYIWFIALNYLKWDKKSIHKYIREAFELEETKMMEKINNDFGSYFVLTHKEQGKPGGR